jgi:prevent-host-death family protein
MNASATEVKTRFGEFMDKAQKEPVTVGKGGRNYAVLLGFDEYQRLLALEDAYWGARAKAAEASGYVGTEEAMRLLEKIK